MTEAGPEARFLRFAGSQVAFATSGDGPPLVAGDAGDRSPDRAGKRHMTLEVFAGRHHIGHPHRIEPERTATAPRALRERATG